MTPSHVLGMISATPYFHFKEKNKSSVSTNLKNEEKSYPNANSWSCAITQSKSNGSEVSPPAEVPHSQRMWGGKVEGCNTEEAAIGTIPTGIKSWCQMWQHHSPPIWGRVAAQLCFMKFFLSSCMSKMGHKDFLVRLFQTHLPPCISWPWGYGKVNQFWPHTNELGLLLPVLSALCWFFSLMYILASVHEPKISFLAIMLIIHYFPFCVYIFPNSLNKIPQWCEWE